MSRFTEPLVVTPHPEGDRWVVLSEFGYEVGGEGSGDVIHIDIGFHTDFASIPRPLWAFLPRCGKYGNAAVIHDYLYWEQPRSRKEADAILLEGMEILDVHWITRYTSYWGVRAGGWWAWWRNPSKKRKSK
jgi:hypothetical protein